MISGLKRPADGIRTVDDAYGNPNQVEVVNAGFAGRLPKFKDPA